VRDGTPCGFAPPERSYAGAEPNLLDAERQRKR